MLRSLWATRVVAGLLLVTMAACSTWHPYTPTVPAETELPTRVRFHLESGESIELKEARLEGDSAYVGEVSPRRITRVPVSSVVSMERAKVAVGRTTFTILGTVVLTLGLVFLGGWGAGR